MLRAPSAFVNQGPAYPMLRAGKARNGGVARKGPGRAGLRRPGGEPFERDMPARRTSPPVEVLSAPTDGVLLVPIGQRGVWGALRSVHQAMASLRENGSTPRTAFVVAMSPEGQIVPGRGADASVFVVGYRLEQSS
jgi:hypothetical protein